MAPGLLDMPDDVMSKIMKNIGIESILTLRKLCHDLRNFIDDVKPDGNLEYINIYLKCDDAISVDYTFCEDDYLWYKKHEEGCLIERPDKGMKVLLKNENFFTVCMKDIESVLRHQKSPLQMFGVYVGRKTNGNEDLAFKKHFERILKSRDHSLQVEFFNASLNQNQLMSILPFLDSKALNRVRISTWNGKLEVDQLVKLDQWNNVQHMGLGDCWVELEYIQHFIHFWKTHINFQTSHFPDLVFLKDMFLQSSKFQKVWIKISEQYDMDDVRRSTELFGPPNLDTRHKMRWYWRIPATNELLEICVMKNAQPIPILLLRIKEVDVPQGDVIRN